MKQLLERLQHFRLSRTHLEVAIVLALFLCGVSVFSVTVSRKKNLTYDNGKITYKGDVVNHRLNGKGRLAYANGDRYQGDFKNGAFDGQGTFTAALGWSYTGHFQNGQANGKGVLKAQNGKTYKGTFKQGIYQK